MPAQPSTMASARSSRLARSISAEMLRAASDRGILEREHRHLGGAHAGAAARRGRIQQIVLDRPGWSATSVVTTEKRARDQARHVEGGLANADRPAPSPTARAASRPVSSKQAMMCAPRRPSPRPCAISAEQARHGEGLVVIALDRDRARSAG